MKTSKQPKSNIFGRRLRSARLTMAIPQDKLGVLVGLDEHTASARISRYENGVHEPALPTANKLAKALNIPLAYLYCEDDRVAQHLLNVTQLNEDQWSQLQDFCAQQLSPKN